MSRIGFLRGLALLAGAVGIACLDLPALLRRSAAAGAAAGADASPAAPPAITPPTRSVKRRG
jgi:hypothetical protein